MKRSSLSSVMALVIFVALTVTACIPAGPEGTSSTPAASKAPADAPAASTTRKGSGPQKITISWANPTSLDPHINSPGMWVSGFTVSEGLVLCNAKCNEAIPGTAEKWDISADGKAYTFHIRKDAKWANGDPVTAHDFEYSYRRLLTPKTLGAGESVGANSYQQTIGIVNALGYLSGKVTDWSQVGVKALDDYRLQLTLEGPNPELALMLGHASMLPVHKATVEQYPREWQLAERFVGNGPYKIHTWVMNSHMVLVPNEHYWNRQNVHLDEIKILFQVENRALAYQNGELDFAELRAVDLTQFLQNAELKSQLATIPGARVTYLAVLRSTNPVLEDIRVRRALSLAINREEVAKVDPQARPGHFLVPPSVPQWEDPGVNKFDVAEAKRLLAEAGYSDLSAFPTITIMTGTNVEPIFLAVADQWQKNLGLKVVMDPVEAGVFTTKRYSTFVDGRIGFFTGSFGKEPTWADWGSLRFTPSLLKQLSLSGQALIEYDKLLKDKSLTGSDRAKKINEFVNANASKEALAFEKAVFEAMQVSDRAKHIAAFKVATRIREETHLWLPITHVDLYYAVKPWVKGLQLYSAGERKFYLTGIWVEK